MASDMQEKRDNPLPKEEWYTLKIKDDMMDTLLTQEIVTNNPNLVELQAEKYVMFYGFGTTSYITVKGKEDEKD